MLALKDEPLAHMLALEDEPLAHMLALEPSEDVTASIVTALIPGTHLRPALVLESSCSNLSVGSTGIGSGRFAPVIRNFWLNPLPCGY
jgi:hypothetical protein